MLRDLYKTALGSIRHVTCRGCSKCAKSMTLGPEVFNETHAKKKEP